MPTSNSVLLTGGQLPPADYELFLTTWQQNVAVDAMPYLISETIPDGIRFSQTDASRYPSASTLLRLHLFGLGGDLTVRRDINLTQDRVLWRFVGPADIGFPFDAFERWDYPHPLVVDEEPLEALLWGVYQSDQRWVENRVGKADLRYPIQSEAERVLIRAYEVHDATTHAVAAIWTSDLIHYTPKRN